MRKSIILTCLLLTLLLVGSASADTVLYDSTWYFSPSDAPTDSLNMMEHITSSSGEDYRIQTTRTHSIMVHQLDVGGADYWFINSALNGASKPYGSANYKTYWGTSLMASVESSTGFAMSGVNNFLTKVPALGVYFDVVRADGSVMRYSMDNCVYVTIMNGIPCVVIYNEAAYRQNSAGGNYQWFGATTYTQIKGQDPSQPIDNSWNGGKFGDWQIFDAKNYQSSTAANTWKYKTTLSYERWGLYAVDNSVAYTFPVSWAGYDVVLSSTADGELLHLTISPDALGSVGSDSGYLVEEGSAGVGTWYQVSNDVPYNPYYPPTVQVVPFNEYLPTTLYYQGEPYKYYKYRGYLKDDTTDSQMSFDISRSASGKWLLGWETVLYGSSPKYYTGKPYDILDYIPEEEEPEEPIEPDKPDVELKPPIEDGTGLPNLGFYPQIDIEFGVDLTGGFSEYFYNQYLGISDAYQGTKAAIDGFMSQIMEIPFYSLKVHIFEYEVMVQDYTRYVVGVKEDYAVPFYNLGVSLSRFVPSTVWLIASLLLCVFSVVAVIEIFTGTFSNFVRRRLI